VLQALKPEFLVGLLWVKSSPAEDVVSAAEAPQKADRIAAAPRTEKVCHEQT
jgi:hypothetical protein